jgi:hypothetical protein
MTDIVAQMQELEADLIRKLEAVRQFLDTFAGASNDAPKIAARNEGAKGKTPAIKIDKFGSYGQAVIDASIAILPGEGESPMPTRVLVEKLAFCNVEVRGENKVNALSALLARSSKIKSHGRSGWTIYGERQPTTTPEDEFASLVGNPAPEEKEPHSSDAGGSVASGWGAPPPSPEKSHSSWGIRA